MFEVCENGCCFENLTLSSSLEMEGEALQDTLAWLRKHLKDDPKGFAKLCPFLSPLGQHFHKRKVLYQYLEDKTFVDENEKVWDELNLLLDAEEKDVPGRLIQFATDFDAYLDREADLYPILEKFDEKTCQDIVEKWLLIGFCYIGCNPESESFIYFNSKN